MVNEVETDLCTRGLSELEVEAWAGFLRTHARLVRELDDELIATYGLPLTSFDVMAQLGNAPGQRLRMSELADAVLLSRSGLTRLVGRLVDQGLLERHDCEQDARGAYAVLTDAGRHRLEEAREIHIRGVRARFLDRLSEPDQRQLSEVWSRLSE